MFGFRTYYNTYVNMSTDQEKIEKIKEIERKFLADIENIKEEYKGKIKALIEELDKQKVDNLKKELGI